MIDPKTDRWVDNITCPHCRWRRPAHWSCSHAKQAAGLPYAKVEEPEMVLVIGDDTVDAMGRAEITLGDEMIDAYRKGFRAAMRLRES